MGLIVQKYGGTSVKDAERVMNVARRITDAYKAGNNVVVAVSLLQERIAEVLFIG